jgi:hypothetical protein
VYRTRDLPVCSMIFLKKEWRLFTKILFCYKLDTFSEYDGSAATLGITFQIWVKLRSSWQGRFIFSFSFCGRISKYCVEKVYDCNFSSSLPSNHSRLFPSASEIWSLREVANWNLKEMSFGTSIIFYPTINFSNWHYYININNTM